MLKKVKKYMEENRMLQQGDCVLVGVSGGADSVALLLILQQLSAQYELHLLALHVHHMLRGAEADADAAFVQNLCQQYQIPCFVEQVPVEEVAKRDSLSLEEAGRNERYRLFGEYRQRYQAKKIAVAHHRDDNTETVLLQMLRGTGLKGLAGMEPVRKDGLIRPLLGCSRREIEAWLSSRGQPWCTDSSNLTREYGRNKLRLDVLPLLRQEFGEGAVQQLTKQCLVYREMDEYFTEAAKVFLQEYEGKELQFPREAFLQQPKPIQRYIALEALGRACQCRRDLGHIHVEELLELIQKNTVAQKCFPYGIIVRNQYGIIYFETQEKQKPKQLPAYEWNLQIQKAKELKNFEENSCTKCFDYDRIKGAVTLRTRQSGDWMQLYADGGKKKIKDILIDCKVPRQERDQIPLVAVGKEILWIYGYRSSQAYRVGTDTKTILRITVNARSSDCGQGNLHEKKKGTEDDRESKGNDFRGRGNEAYSGDGGSNQQGV